MTSILDRAHLAKYTGGDRALEHEIFAIYLAEAETQLERLHQAATPADQRIIAHTIKGAARSLGAMALADAAVSAEQALHSGDAASWSSAINTVASAAADLRAALEQELAGAAA